MALALRDGSTSASSGEMDSSTSQLVRSPDRLSRMLRRERSYAATGPLGELRDLARRDAELSSAADALRQREREVGEIRAWAEANDAFFAAYRAHEGSRSAAVKAADAELASRKDELAHAESALARAHDEDACIHAQHSRRTRARPRRRRRGEPRAGGERGQSSSGSARNLLAEEPARALHSPLNPRRETAKNYCLVSRAGEPRLFSR
jgi:hypothetical protein